MRIDIYDEYKNNKRLGDKFIFGVNFFDDLIEHLKNATIYKRNFHKLLPNFISINNEVEKSNIMVQTLYSMVNQSTNK